MKKNGNEKKIEKNGGYGVKRGYAVSCPQAPVIVVRGGFRMVNS